MTELTTSEGTFSTMHMHLVTKREEKRKGRRKGGFLFVCFSCVCMYSSPEKVQVGKPENRKGEVKKIEP